ncbi:MAG: CatA-like O-acetyltransferase [Eubacteriales bacterium]|jgi:chloramphenicol O-acetyltransferase type A
MFNFIDYENWNRREIYDKFLGYTFSLTTEIDITSFRRKTKEKGYKFYPSICWAIGKTVNSDQDFRFARIDGRPGYYDHLKVHYNMLRNDGTNLFTHAVTDFNEDFDAFYKQFEKDKTAAEGCGKLYNYDTPQPDSVHVSVMPNIVHTSLAMSKPAEFSAYNKPDTAFIPFLIIGKFYEKDGKIVLPVTAELHHCVNDGFHAQKLFMLLEKSCREAPI